MSTLFTRLGLLCVALLALSPAWALLTWDDFDDDKPRENSTPIVLTEGLDRSYTNELVTYSVTFPANTTVNSLRLHDEDDVVPPLTFVTYQLSDAVINAGIINSAKISFWVDALAASGTRQYRLYHGTRTDYSAPPFPSLGVTHTDLTQASVDISNGAIGIRLWGGTQAYAPAADPATLPGMLRGVKGTDNTWRGSGAMVADATVTNHALTVYEEGALWRTYKQVITFTGGGTYELRVKVFPNADFVQIDEYGNNSFTQAYVNGSVGYARQNAQILRLSDFNPDKFLTYTVFATNIQSTAMNTVNNQVYTAGLPAGACWNGGGWGGAYAADAGKQDVIGIVPVKTGKWTGNSTWLTFNTDSTNLQELRFSMSISERHSLLVVTNKIKAVLSQAQIDATKVPSYIIYWGSTTGFLDRITPDACYLWKLRNTWCDFPLNKVKDWVLTYNDSSYPHPRTLFGAPDDIPTVMATAQNRLLNDPSYAFQRTSLMDTQALEYIRYGTVADLFRTHTPQRDDWDMGDATNSVKEQMAVGYPSGCYVLFTGQAEDMSILYADVLWGALPSEEKTRWSRYALALAYILRDEDNWGTPTYSQGHLAPYGNFNACRWLGLGMAAVFFEGHPDAAEWRTYAKGQMDQETAATLSSDGVYLECISNYYPFWWQNVTRLSWGLQRHGWGSYAANTLYQKAAQFFVDSLTPPDATFHQDPVTHVGKRMIPPIGHHPGAGYRNYGATAWAATLFGHGTQDGDWSQWAWNQNGKFYGHHYRLPVNLFIADPSAAQQTPSLLSRAWDDFGFVFRNHVGSGKESYFLLKNSRVEWHQDSDEGSFHMFGKGVLLAGDGLNLMSSYPTCTTCDPQKTDTSDRASQRTAFHHNLITFQGPTNDGDIRGQWQSFSTYATVDYGHANIPKVSTGSSGGTSNDSFDRRCLLVKSVDPDGPEYYVLQDTTNGPDLPQWNLDVHSPLPEVNPGGRAGWVTFPGYTDPGFGVALDTAFVTPSNISVWTEQGYVDQSMVGNWGVKGHALLHATPAAALGQVDNWVPYAASDWIYSSAFSKDLQYVVSGGAATDRNVKLWNRTTCRLVRTFPQLNGIIWACAISENNQMVAGGTSSQTVLWNLNTGAQFFSFAYGANAFGIAFSPDNGKVAVSCTDNKVRIWNTSTGALLQTLDVQQGTLRGLAFSTDSARLAVAGSTRATIWDVATGGRLVDLGTLSTYEDGAASVCFSPDGTELVVGGIPNGAFTDAKVTVWDATIPEGQQAPYTRTQFLWRTDDTAKHTNYVYVVKYSPDGSSIISVAQDSWAIEWAVDSGTRIRWITNLTSGGKAAVWANDSSEFWVSTFALDGSGNGTILHFQSYAQDPYANTVGWPGGIDRYIEQAQSDFIYSITFSKDLQYVASGGENTDRNVKLWDRKTGKLVRSFPQLNGIIWACAISENNQMVAGGTSSQTVLWNLSTGAQLYSFAYGANAYGIAFSPDNGKVAVSCTDNKVRIWNTSSGALLQTLDVQRGTLYNLAFSADSARLAVAGSTRATIWDVTTGGRLVDLGTVSTYEDGAASVCFSPDGLELVVGGIPNGAFTDAKVTVWDATIPEGQQAPYTRTQFLWRTNDTAKHTNYVYVVKYSPDGAYLVSAGQDSLALFWKADTGALQRSLPTLTSGGKDVMWASDGADFWIGTFACDGSGNGTILHEQSYAGTVTFPFLTVHYPRYQGSASPTITSIADGKGATVQYTWGAGGTDTILMSNSSFTYNEGGINFTGKVAAVRNLDGERWMTLVDGTSLTYNNHTLNSPGVYHFNPVTALTAPAQGATVTAPVTLTATASYAGGTVSKVEFYDGVNKLGEDTTAPYSYNWSNPTLGAHMLKAKAIGSDATSGTSEPIAVTVVNP
ncbi:MAG: Ig-like domain-containing protein [Armatimonadota bacterium]